MIGIAGLLAGALLGPGGHSGGHARGHEEERREDARIVRIEEHALVLTLPPLAELARTGEHRWHGWLGASDVSISFQTLARERFALVEPEDVLAFGPSTWADTEHASTGPVPRRALRGAFGEAAYAVLERSELRARAGGTLLGLRLRLAGLVAEAGYWITVDAEPAPGRDEEELLRAFLETGVAYSGDPREHRWSDEEAHARWLVEAPPRARTAWKPPVRGEHFVVLGDSSAGAAFLARLEACHELVRELFPFEDVGERRLLPLLLFRSGDEYGAFAAAALRLDADGARRAKGHAARDYYATWSASPRDPVHLHGVAHQLLANRLWLRGGSAWFLEGLAAYASTTARERDAAAALVRRGRHVPLAELARRTSLPHAGDESALAALVVECLRERAPDSERFPRFLARLGRGPGGVAALEAALAADYGLDVAGLEARLAEHCRAR